MPKSSVSNSSGSVTSQEGDGITQPLVWKWHGSPSLEVGETEWHLYVRTASGYRLGEGCLGKVSINFVARPTIFG